MNTVLLESGETSVRSRSGEMQAALDPSERFIKLGEGVPGDSIEFLAEPVEFLGEAVAM